MHWPNIGFAFSTRRRRAATSSIPGVLAPGTLADDLEWREISGAGSLYTFTVCYRAVSPHFADDVPQVLAVVAWDEVTLLGRNRERRSESIGSRHAREPGVHRLPGRRHHDVALRIRLSGCHSR